MLRRLPLRFEANRGQWNSQVRYAARDTRNTLFLTAHGAVVAAGARRVEMDFLHANPAPAIEALDRLPTRTDYFRGNPETWRRAVPSFSRVAYRSVYPGIDVVYYGRQDQLEYDFVLRPGADPGSIRLKFRGADHLHFTAAGDLSVESGGARFLQKRPSIYQVDPVTAARRPVEGGYQLLSRGVVGLRLSSYNRSQPLVIDPVVTYSNFVGGAATDAITAVKADSQGHIVVAGYTTNYDLQSTGTAAQGSNAGSTDCFIIILDPTNNSVAYMSYLGGTRDESPTAMVLDSADHIYLTGTTTSSDFPTAGNAVQTALHLSTTSSTFTSDAFVSEIDPNTPGGLVYSTYVGGTGNDIPRDLALDAAGNMYIIGYTESSDLPVTGSAYAAVLYGPSDAFLAKLDPTSTSLAYSSYLGGEARDDGRSIAVGPDGLVYFAASTLSQQFPLAGPSYSSTLTGFGNVIIGVMDMTQSGTPSLVYATYFGGTGLEEVRKIALDANGKLLVTGLTLSTDLPVTSNAMQSQANGPCPLFLARVNPKAQPNAFLEYSTYLGGSGGEVPYDMTLDSSGSVYLTGYTLSPDFPVSRDAAQPQFGNGVDAFLLKLNLATPGAGALQYGTYFGATGVHVGSGIVVTKQGNIYVGGSTTPDFSAPALQGGYNGGASDGFVVALK
ncbi:MAG TPA: SBBP repeat-containing protein [Bryobacteraceae bacterium]|nr:SBBP repeat-containing protein [Bryobacteraceae bacterium]